MNYSVYFACIACVRPSSSVIVAYVICWCVFYSYDIAMLVCNAIVRPPSLLLHNANLCYPSRKICIMPFCVGYRAYVSAVGFSLHYCRILVICIVSYFPSRRAHDAGISVAAVILLEALISIIAVCASCCTSTQSSLHSVYNWEVLLVHFEHIACMRGYAV